MPNSKYLELHDAKLIGINLIDGNLELHIASNFEIIKIFAKGVERLICNDFREGNIILEIFTTKDQEVCKTLLKDLYPKPTIETEAKHNIFLEKLLHKIASNELTLLHVAPSYGAEITALCHEVTQSTL